MSTQPIFSALRRVGGIANVAGATFLVGGAVAWFLVTKQLREERIAVPANAPAFPGKSVQDPVTAYVQALVIKGNAERGAGGRTFADISDALRSVEKDSEEERELRRQSASLATAASLRTSLMTSVLAYGVSAFVAGVGAVFAITGTQLRRMDKK